MSKIKFGRKGNKNALKKCCFELILAMIFS